MINVPWKAAKAYAEWLSLETGKHYRLPSEAEWEYAARANTANTNTTAFFWGPDAAGAKDYAWFSENSEQKTHPVGEKQANNFGLYDTAGNVEEWTADCLHGNYQNAPSDGSAWEKADEGSCDQGVIRGGYLYNVQAELRSATRDWFDRDDRIYTLGFRLAQDN